MVFKHYVPWLIALFVLSITTLAAANDIMEAAKQGNLAEVKRLVEQDPGLVNSKDDRQCTPLHFAADQGQTEVARYLMAQGADIAARDVDGDTPLHWAASAGQQEMIELLMTNGALVDARNNGQATPLVYAAMRGHEDAARLLIANGAEVNVKTANDETPLMHALWRVNPPLVKLLVDHGADVDVRLDRVVTPLFFAVAFRDKDIADLLLEQGQVIDLQNEHGLTMLHYAAARGFADQVETLLDKGANIDARCINGKTPLHYPSQWGHDSVVALLAARGADTVTVPAPGFQGEYLGRNKPGLEPEVLAPDAFLTPFAPHGSLAFSPDGSELLWCHHAMPVQAMWYMKQENGRWSPPIVAPFTDPALEYADGHPCFSPDGRRVFFRSQRPLSDNDTSQQSLDIWYIEKKSGGWSDPVNLGPIINSDHHESGPTISNNGTLYFTREGDERGIGASDIYKSTLVDGRYTEPENLGPAVNTPFHELVPAVAPDESYLIFTSNRPEESGRSLRLYVSWQRDDGTWTEAVSLGEKINSGRVWQPFISYDGQYLFFNQADDYSWVSTRIIEELKPEELR